MSQYQTCHFTGARMIAFLENLFHIRDHLVTQMNQSPRRGRLNIRVVIVNGF